MKKITCKCGGMQEQGARSIDWEKLEVSLEYRCYDCGRKAVATSQLRDLKITFIESDESI